MRSEGRASHSSINCDVVVRIVTTNEGKAREFRKLGEEFGVDVEIVKLPKLEIQSSSLELISIYAAVDASIRLGTAVVVEDAGLFIEALNGFPGPYSSYVYKTIGPQGIIKLMEGVENRRAYFKSVMTYADISKGIVKTFSGVVYGAISREMRGSMGFGFDPVFIPEGYARTFAEMSTEEKNTLSHRSRAFRELIKWLRTYG